MLLLSALWLAAVHALASPLVPAGLRGPVDVPSRAATVGVTATAAATAADRARGDEAAGTGLWTLLHADGEFRPSARGRLPAVGRTSDRSVPPVRSPGGLARFASADLSVLPVRVAPPAAHQLSHAAASRGGLLPYYPTAPPRQG